MSDKGIKSLINVCVATVFLYFFIGVNINFEIAGLVISNLTHFVPFIITGIICLLLGINEYKFGSLIFGIVTICLWGGSIW